VDRPNGVDGVRLRRALVGPVALRAREAEATPPGYRLLVCTPSNAISTTSSGRT
jgi:hypothetical protein